MKLLMTTDNLGGVWTHALELCQGLEPRGVAVMLAVMGTPLSREQRREVQSLPNVDLQEGVYKLEWMESPWEEVAAAGQWLLHLARRFRPDVVHLNSFAHGALPWPAPLLVAGHSCVLSWYEGVRGSPAGPEWDDYRTRVTQGIHAADLVVAPSLAMLLDLERHYGPLPQNLVIPNGRSASRYRARGKRSLVLAAGRAWEEAKNGGGLAEAAASIGWPVYVAGQTRHPEGGAVSPPRGNTKFLGQISPAAMAAWYGRASIYAFPARYEPFGLSILEAALSECALVLGDIPSLRETWFDRACFVPPDDPAALATAVNTLIADPGLRRRQATRARERALELSSSAMAERYLAAYRSLHAAPLPNESPLPDDAGEPV